MPRIITRAEWGFDGWLDPKNPPSFVNEKTERTEFFTHYQGGPTRYATGFSVPRSIHRMHKANGWKGIGYGHIVDNDGTIYEGRGFNLSGSHCPDHNRSGYSAQGHIGLGEKPSAAMLTSLRWLYDESCRRSGRSLSKKGHRDGTATSCPGDVLYAWVKAGMPASNDTTTASPEEDDMPLTNADVEKILGYDSIPSPMLAPSNPNVTVRAALSFAMQWSLAGRNAAQAAARDAAVARSLAEASALKGEALTRDEITAAAERGAQAALDSRITDATVTLEVAP